MAKKTNANGSNDVNWGLFYQEHSKDLDKRKSIKVKLPLRQHIKLHALKLFTENNISETVEEAIDGYFEVLKEAEENGSMEHAASAEALRASEAGAAETEA